MKRMNDRTQLAQPPAAGQPLPSKRLRHPAAPFSCLAAFATAIRPLCRVEEKRTGCSKLHEGGVLTMCSSKFWIAATFLAVMLCAPISAQVTQRVSVSTLGAQGNSESYAYPSSSISADGRFVAFNAYASNLVAGDTNGVPDVFVRDRQSGATERVSVATGGAQGNSYSGNDGVSISADGRFVAFNSAATNLVAGDTNLLTDIFVRDRQSGTTERVSVATGGAQGNLGSGDYGVSISADGRFVAFDAYASNLVAGDTNGYGDVFVRDRQSGTTERVSVATGGAQGDASSFFPSVSADGRFVAFFGSASNLVAGDTNGFRDVFVHDRQSGTTERVSVATGGAEGNDDSDWQSISADGRFVAFSAFASNLVAGDTNGYEDVFVRDRQSGTTERVSVATGGAQGNDDSDWQSISADGRFVAFASFATNLVAGDTNGHLDVFVRDRDSAFTIAPFCFGDGTGTACPCLNNSPGGMGRGCENSNPAHDGCLLTASGGVTVSVNNLSLTSSGMMDGSYCIFLQGTASSGPGVISPVYDGLLCVGGILTRLGRFTTWGSTTTQVGIAGLGGVPAGGGTFYYQAVYRNTAIFCTPASLNTSNGMQINWIP